VGEGVLHSQVAVNLHQIEQSWFTLSLEGVESAAIIRAWPSLAGKVEGLLEAHLRGHLGREWSGSGDLFLGRGKVLGVDVTDWRLPLTWSFAPGERRGEIAVHETNARVASGRATGRTSLTWGSGLRLDGQIRFFNLELRSLLRQGADSTPLGSGHVTGQFDFAGMDLHSVDDLTGSLTAALTQTQAFEFPVLREIAPFLGIQASSAFDRGELRARLTRGVLRIQRLELDRSSLHISIEGSVTLGGRLDLDVTARTGPGNLESVRLRLPVSLPLLHLRATGAARSPTIRAEPW
jgi:hypothetical protein